MIIIDSKSMKIKMKIKKRPLLVLNVWFFISIFIFLEFEPIIFQKYTLLQLHPKLAFHLRQTLGPNS